MNKNSFLIICIRWALRLTIFVGCLYLYFANPVLLDSFWQFKLSDGFGIQMVLWMLLLIETIYLFIPQLNREIGFGKFHKINYCAPKKPYEELKMLKDLQPLNKGAARMMFVWFTCAAAVGVLYFCGVIGNRGLLIWAGIYYITDLTFVIFFCPFQVFVMKNFCCVNCRIYGYGPFFIYTPLIFLNNFFSWTLFAPGILLLLVWELQVAYHPERFVKVANAALQCQNCEQRLCRVKKKMKKRV